VILALVVASPRPLAGQQSDSPFWKNDVSPSAFEQRESQRLQRARDGIRQLVAAGGERTIDRTLRAFDDVRLEIDNAASDASLAQAVHPDSAMRAAGERIGLEAAVLHNELWLDRRVFDALAAIDSTPGDREARHYLRRVLAAFRRGGVDRGVEDRTRIAAIRTQLDSLEQVYARHVAEDRDTLLVEPRALAGLPADWLEKHPPRPDGRVAVTLDYPDVFPVLQYAQDREMRRRAFTAFFNRAAPENLPVLDRIIELRHELTGLLEAPTWTDYLVADDMAGSSGRVEAFLRDVVAAANELAPVELELFEDQFQAEGRGGERPAWWDFYYLKDVVARQGYGVDARELRPYFPYERVKAGILELGSRLFGMQFREMTGVPVWHESVEVYEVRDGDRFVGRLYLDMHPRPGKFTHAAAFGPRSGVSGRQTAEVVLVCNFPGGERDEAALMEHVDVRTFLHEFGHAVHGLFSGSRPWFGTSVDGEADFGEAPSQLLEEWAWRAAALAILSGHVKTGASLPDSLVDRLRESEEVGKALTILEQMAFARVSADLHDPERGGTPADSVVVRALRETFPMRLPDEQTRLQASFGHLATENYSSTYYVYMWALIVAKDLFTRFECEGLLDPEAGMAYRRAVLEAGTSAPAAELVESFLGRPFTMDAWRRWLTGDAEEGP
jgi:thimet oligopeptidase